jgi:arylsulfatase A-like enzyme
MDAGWADRFEDFPVTQPWPDDDAIARMDAYEGAFTSQGQRFKGGKSPWPLMPDDVSTRERFDHMITGYDASIAYVDHHVGLVLEELDRQGVLDEAVIIISADHGDAFGEHGIYSDHVCADECIHRIPLILRWPGLTGGGRHVSSLLTNVDLAPTLCDLMGFEPAADWDGSSFAAHVRGEPGGPDRDHIVWDHGLYTVQRAVRTRQHLLIHTYDDWGYEQFNPVELYDIEADPYQTTDLAAEEPELVRQLGGLMGEWVQAQMRKPHWVADPLSEILRERKRAGPE